MRTSAREIYWGEPNDKVLSRSWAENFPAEPYESVVRPLFELARAGQVARRLVELYRTIIAESRRP